MTHTCFQLDLNEIDLERWREVLPLAAELIINNDELMTQSPSQKISTVSIYGALSEILSKPTESLNFYNNKSTDRTLFSKAPSTTESTTTSTSTTTTTTISKVQNDSIKVDNISSISRAYTSDITPVAVNIQSESFFSQDYNKYNSANMRDNLTSAIISPSNHTNYHDILTNSMNFNFFQTDSNIWLNKNEKAKIILTNGNSHKNKDSKILITDRSPELDLMTSRIENKYGSIGLFNSSIFPVYNRKLSKELTTFPTNDYGITVTEENEKTNLKELLNKKYKNYVIENNSFAAHSLPTSHNILSLSQLQKNNIKTGKTVLNGTKQIKHNREFSAKTTPGYIAHNLTVFFLRYFFLHNSRINYKF